jgi:hypothetical protein
MNATGKMSQLSISSAAKAIQIQKTPELLESILMNFYLGLEGSYSGKVKISVQDLGINLLLLDNILIVFR